MVEVNGYEIQYKDIDGNTQTTIVGGVNEEYAVAMFVRKYYGWYETIISVKEME